MYYLKNKLTNMFGGGHISGHSGTDFKHKKAFKILIEQNSHPIRKQKRVKFESLNKHQYDTSGPWKSINLLLAFLIISSVGLTSWIVTNTTEAYRSNKHPIATTAQQISIDQHLAKGTMHIAQGDTYAAQREILNALRIDRHNLSANIAMFKLLRHTCETKDESCVVAYEYGEYLQSKRGIHPAAIENLEIAAQ